MKTKLKLLIFRVDKETKYKKVETIGCYTESSLIKLIWIVLKHRYYHFFQGEGWID